VPIRPDMCCAIPLIITTHSRLCAEPWTCAGPPAFLHKLVRFHFCPTENTHREAAAYTGKAVDRIPALTPEASWDH
jgi:hypothetical protein